MTAALGATGNGIAAGREIERGGRQNIRLLLGFRREGCGGRLGERRSTMAHDDPACVHAGLYKWARFISRRRWRIREPLSARPAALMGLFRRLAPFAGGRR